jgi:hypothetical protein
VLTPERDAIAAAQRNPEKQFEREAGAGADEETTGERVATILLPNSVAHAATA